LSNNSVQQESNAERQREHATSVEFVSKSERLYKRYHAIRLSTISVKITITIKFFFLFADYLEYAECFEEQYMYHRFFNQCRFEAEDRAALEPEYDYCKSVVLH